MRIAAALGLALALAGCAGGGGPGRDDRYARLLKPTANPSEIVAVELAFAREAQDKGQWTAFRKFATEDAVMFVPEQVGAQEWLKGRADPSPAMAWQPFHIWSSCDGSLAAAQGAWQRPDGSTGYFTTVWKRQDKGGYRWVATQDEPLPTPLVAPEFIGTTVAVCKGAPAAVAPAPTPGAIAVDGKSRDGTLEWSVTTGADNHRRIQLSYWDGTAWQSAADANAGTRP